METIARLPKPLGVVIPSDDVGPRLLQACDEAGVAVPEQVAILGCDNDPLVCDYAPIRLSSVDNDWDRIGYEGARLLDRIMDGEAAPSEPILIPPKTVVTRQSTDILAIPDPQIARALRFIWQHFAEPIGPPEVAANAGINRRKLERDQLERRLFRRDAFLQRLHPRHRHPARRLPPRCRRNKESFG